MKIRTTNSTYKKYIVISSFGFLGILGMNQSVHATIKFHTHTPEMTQKSTTFMKGLEYERKGWKWPKTTWGVYGGLTNGTVHSKFGAKEGLGNGFKQVNVDSWHAYSLSASLRKPFSWLPLIFGSFWGIGGTGHFHNHKYPGFTWGAGLADLILGGSFFQGDLTFYDATQHIHQTPDKVEIKYNKEVVKFSKFSYPYVSDCKGGKEACSGTENEENNSLLSMEQSSINDLSENTNLVVYENIEQLPSEKEIVTSEEKEAEDNIEKEAYNDLELLALSVVNAEDSIPAKDQCGSYEQEKQGQYGHGCHVKKDAVIFGKELKMQCYGAKCKTKQTFKAPAAGFGLRVSAQIISNGHAWYYQKKQHDYARLKDGELHAWSAVSVKNDGDEIASDQGRVKIINGGAFCSNVLSCHPFNMSNQPAAFMAVQVDEAEVMQASEKNNDVVEKVAAVALEKAVQVDAAEVMQASEKNNDVVEKVAVKELEKKEDVIKSEKQLVEVNKITTKQENVVSKSLIDEVKDKTGPDCNEKGNCHGYGDHAYYAMKLSTYTDCTFVSEGNSLDVEYEYKAKDKLIFSGHKGMTAGNMKNMNDGLNVFSEQNTMEASNEALNSTNEMQAQLKEVGLDLNKDLVTTYKGGNRTTYTKIGNYAGVHINTHVKKCKFNIIPPQPFFSDPALAPLIMASKGSKNSINFGNAGYAPLGNGALVGVGYDRADNTVDNATNNVAYDGHTDRIYLSLVKGHGNLFYGLTGEYRKGEYDLNNNNTYKAKYYGPRVTVGVAGMSSWAQLSAGYYWGKTTITDNTLNKSNDNNGNLIQLGFLAQMNKALGYRFDLKPGVNVQYIFQDIGTVGDVVYDKLNYGRADFNVGLGVSLNRGWSVTPNIGYRWDIKAACTKYTDPSSLNPIKICVPTANGVRYGVQAGKAIMITGSKLDALAISAYYDYFKRSGVKQTQWGVLAQYPF